MPTTHEPRLESRLESYFNKRVRLAGGLTMKLQTMTKGNSDRLVLMPGGAMYLVELKTTVGRASPAQLHRHEIIEDRTGIHVYVLSGLDDVSAFLSDVIGRVPRSARRKYAS